MGQKFHPTGFRLGVVKKHNAPNKDSLGMYIESVQKKLPLK